MKLSMNLTTLLKGENIMEIKRSKGFANLPVDEHRRICALGGKRAHELGVAHKFTTQEAADAGRKGGFKVSTNKEHMRRIGALGGKKSALKRRTAIKLPQ